MRFDKGFIKSQRDVWSFEANFTSNHVEDCAGSDERLGTLIGDLDVTTDLDASSTVQLSS